jgi:periodic tryptophan protein 2
MNYKFSNLLGVPYRGGTVVFHENQLLACASNRVRDIALSDASSTTYPFESLHQIQVLAVSPDGGMLLTIDTTGRLMLALRRTKVLLHRMRLKAPSRAAKFSPDGRFIAIAVGKVVQVRI